ncbi:MAG TPA: phytanoyl-CoA dioxygenase family protein, partial [Candidatus Binatus sp.]|nr:phytanoyl-CoA dioxygenase family protein [Candidatus Binatus sp.]
EQATNPSYWRTLYPSFSVADAPPVLDLPLLDAATLDRYARGLDQWGYFCSESPIAQSLSAPLLECIEAVRKAGWPPVFAYVYDQLWTLWNAAPIAQILTAALGKGYKAIPHGWCHYVQPVRGASGWPPHIDGNLPNRMSIWIPLTDATLDNGCIYLLPKDMNTSAIGQRRELRNASNLQMRELLQRSRAIPAAAGSLLGWQFRILHWGSTAHGAGSPRVSLVYEFIAANEAPIKNELPLYDPSAPIPDLARRLHSIGRAIRQYMRYELRMRRYAELAAELINLKA